MNTLMSSPALLGLYKARPEVGERDSPVLVHAKVGRRTSKCGYLESMCTTVCEAMLLPWDDTDVTGSSEVKMI